MMNVSGEVCPALLGEEGLDIGESGVNVMRKATVDRGQWRNIFVEGYGRAGWMSGKRGKLIG